MERTWRAYVLPSLGFLVLLVLHAAAVVYWWPDFEENIESVQAMVPIAKLQNVIAQIGEAGVTSYVHFQHFVKFSNILGTVAAVLFSCGAVAGEAHRGTLEIWLARPFSRHRILMERWFAGALALSLPILISTATIPTLLERLVGEEMELGPLMLGAVHQTLFLLVIYSLSFLLSTVSRRPLEIAVTLLFLGLFEGVIYLVQEITHTSIYRLADLDDYALILHRGSLDLPLVGGFVLTTAALVGLSLFAFSRRVP